MVRYAGEAVGVREVRVVVDKIESVSQDLDDFVPREEIPLFSRHQSPNGSMTTATAVTPDETTEPVKFTAAYEGPATEGGRIQATLFGPALFHLSTLIERSAQVVYPEKSALRVQIAANLREGSFEFDLLAVAATLATGAPQAALSALSIGDIDTLLQWIGIRGDGSTGLLGFLKRFGTPVVTKAEPSAGGRYDVTVIGNNNVVHVVNNVAPGVVRLLRDDETREAAVESLAPLRKAGINGFRIGGTPTSPAVHFDKAEAQKVLKPEAVAKEMLVSQSETAVEIVSPNLDADNKWKVRQGDAPFWIRITDEDFNREVKDGVRAFRNGDYLVGIMRVTLSDTASGLVADREMVKIIDHKMRERQAPLL